MVSPPAPGLDGSYTGSCIVCLEGTDTGMGFTGEPEWVLAGLTLLGLPLDQALAIMGWAHDDVPDQDVSARFRVCAGCVAKSPAPFPAPDLVPDVTCLERVL